MKTKRASYERRKNRSYIIMLIPFLVGFLLLMAGIYFNSLKFSFNTINMNGSAGYSLTFVGIENFKFALTIDPDFVNNLRDSFMEMLMNIPLVILYSLLIAVILNMKLKGRMVFRAIFFIPVILATGFMAKADALNAVFNQQWNSMGADASGASTLANGLVKVNEVQYFLMSLSISPQIAGYIIGAVGRIFDIVNIAGVQMLIFLSGLQSIPSSVYEASDIDGASAWERFWLITFPMISPMILVNVVYTIINSFTDTENVIMRQIQEQSFSVNRMGVAAAMAWLYFIMIAISIAVIVWIISRYVYYQQKD